MPFESNNDERSALSTRSYRTTNGTARKATAFEWDFQDDMLKLIIAPELPEMEQSEKRRYDYKNSWVTCIARPKCIDLWNAVKEKVIPAIEQKQDKFVSVPVANVNQFGIGVRVDEKLGVVAYVKLIKNINPENLTTPDEIVYEFRKGEVIEDYNNETGQFGGRSVTENEFLLFMEDLKSFYQASSNAWVHSARVVDRTFKDMLMTDVRAIGNKVGAQMSTPYSAQRSGSTYGQPSLFDKNSMNAPTDQITSLDDLNLPME